MKLVLVDLDLFFKDMEVSYNFPRDSLLQKTHEFFLISKIPLGSQNCQKWTSTKMIQKWHSCIFSFQTPSKLSWNHKNFRVWSFMLKIHQRFKKCDLPFWCEMIILPLVSFLLIFCIIFVLCPYLTPKSWNTTLLTQLTHKKITKD